MYAELENSDLRGEIARLERKLDAAKPAATSAADRPKEARMAIYELDGTAPEFPADGLYWIADTASVIGKVRLHTNVSIWFGSVLRGDNEWIEIGTRSQIQDNATLHTDPGFPLTIGRDCVIGHNVVLHGCTIGNGSLIGMGAIVLNGAKIGANCLVGAGALVTEGKVYPDNSMILGAPAKAVRATDDAGARHDRARGRRLCQALEAVRRGAEAHRMNSGGRWQFFIDRGGTFTDIVARAPDGRLITHKLLSENPEAYPDAADRRHRRSARRAHAASRFPRTASRASDGHHGRDQRAARAQGRSAPPHRQPGFRDALEIGYQARPKIFARRIEKPSMLYARVAEVPERVRADGWIEMPLDHSATIAALRAARAEGIAAVAIVFMHAYAFPSMNARRLRSPARRASRRFPRATR